MTTWLEHKWGSRFMLHAPITPDAFHAIANTKRRQMLGALITLRNRHGELAVNAIVEALGWRQPQVSKHLAVLRRVGLVSVRREGRKRMYRVHLERLKPVDDWIKIYRQFWKS